MKSSQWTTYRTRFLVKAKQLSSTLSFVDPLGRQHSGRKGDYLVESSDGVISIAPRQIFEDIYVPITLLDAPRDGEFKIGQPTPNVSKIAATKTVGLRMDALRTNGLTIEPNPDDLAQLKQDSPNANALDFAPLEIEDVAFAGSAIARHRDAESRRLVRDSASGVRRKLPQPCRERRHSAPRLRLM